MAGSMGQPEARKRVGSPEAARLQRKRRGGYALLRTRLFSGSSGSLIAGS
ncbi:MAG: hypothetical protein M3275_07410 [Thermoproteota archaeon]|nr:hypothetical protein [Thermoproteota archaeon]